MAKDLYVPVTLRGNRLEAKTQLGQTVIVTEGPEKYTPAPITPSESEQTIPTKDKQLTADVVVEPIPSEYVIPTGTEEITVTENGTVSRDVSSKATVTVNTNVPIPPGYIIPSGNLKITENGQYDITEKASVTVDVPAPVPTGTKQILISENGTTIEDVAGYANAEISVDVPTEKDYEVLPTEYQRVEYIESTGTQWINTGYYASTKKTSAHIGVTPKSKASIQGICGARNNNLAADATSCNVFYMTNNTFRLDWALGSTSASVATALNIYSEIQCARLVSDTDVDMDGPFLVGNFSNGSVPFSTGFVGRIHFAKLYDNGKPVRYLIPCYRKLDGIIGMYDTVNDVFYTNAGTGTFGKGPDA